jgi:esterase/lipase
MTEEPVEIIVDGQSLRGKLFTPAENKKNLAILFLHGWTGRPNVDAAKILAANGFTAMTFSLRGHNDSQGDINTLTRADFIRDTETAYDFFADKLPTGTPIFAAGSSFGSYLAAILSTSRPIAGLSLRVPANYPDEGWDEPQIVQAAGFDHPTVFKWRQQPLNFDATKPLRAVHDFSRPVQIIEAEKDELVPHETVQNYMDAITDKSQLEHHLMEGWPHSLGDDEQRNKQYQDILLNWLNKQI